MIKPDFVMDVFLQPGEFYFGDAGTRVRTLLGSCVAITMWHPKLHIGGMCHFMLPSRCGKLADELDGRYAEEAIQLFQQEIRAAGTRPADYQVKMFGGGNMFKVPSKCMGPHTECNNVACRNVQAARRLLEHHGHRIVAEHVGEHGHRNVIFDIWSGDVWLKHARHSALSDVLNSGDNRIEKDQCTHRR